MSASSRTRTTFSSGGGRLRPTQSSMSMYQFSSRPSISTSAISMAGGGLSAYGRGYGGGLGAGYGGGLGAGYGGGLVGVSSGSAMLLGSSTLVDEKNTLQNLNERLASFLSRVKSLEDCNKDLERQIREFGTRSIEGFDWSIYEKTVKPIQQQILEATLQNSRIALEIDNAKLAAEDFKNKWDSEQMLRLSVENDIDGLRQLKDTYMQLQSSLVDEIAGLEDEIAFMKKDHEEQLRVLRQQKTAEIDVEVDSAPSIDLSAKLQEMRETYAKLADQNKKDLDNWYQEQVQIQVTQTTQANQACQGVKAELAEYRNQLQILETEHSSLLGSLKGLENNLMNIEARYDMELQGLQCRIAQLEGELGQIRNNILQQTQEYEKLLNMKMNLETEIQQYRRLLGGGGESLGSVGMSFSSLGGKSTGGTTTIITTTKTEKEKF
ncbi:keratin, type I cytoskeletal 47 kDa-like [Stegostoma tigrinum]|uniref:keratin, type I cytoskeletal 47 kDa-like n=1 Tax=Stegostoma tigrinum TaxID=3053191 RepID=UPI00202AEDDA|nr:keratin, type I cytoskeletal 47 kDa-like [Stegostoma tigrinum]